MGRVALQHGAVVGNPARGIQVDAPLFGVNTVLAQDQAAVVAALEQSAQKARVAGGDCVVDPHGREGFDHFGQHPDGRVHGAHGPEVINKTRVGTALHVLLGGVVPTGFGVEKLRGVHTALQLAGHFFQHHRAALGELDRAAKVIVQLAVEVKHRHIALEGQYWRVGIGFG